MKETDVIGRARMQFLAGCVMLGLVASAQADGQKVVIKGSNTFGEELGPILIREFRQSHPTAVFELEAKGSPTGFAALLAGECDIASSSRPASEDERRLVRSSGLKLRSYLIGYYGVAVVVNVGNPVERLSSEQVRDVFTGSITNWKPLGGPDAPIHLYIRNPVSGTYLGFQELAMERKPYAPSAKMLTRYATLAKAVKDDPNGIGYVSMDLAAQRDVKPVRINKILPSVLTVNEDDYPYSRGLRLCTIEGHESPATKAFISFVLSSAGQDILALAGFVRSNEPLMTGFER